MALSEKDIEHVANLARIELGNKEKKKYTEELSVILDFVNQLQELDTSNIEPLYQVTGLVNSTRKDGKPLFLDGSHIDEMISQAPESENNFIKVKAVLDKNK